MTTQFYFQLYPFKMNLLCSAHSLTRDMTFEAVIINSIKDVFSFMKSSLELLHPLLQPCPLWTVP